MNIAPSTPASAIPLSIPPSAGIPPEVLTDEKVDAIISAARKLSENPLFDEYLRAVEEYRRVNNTAPDAD